MIIQGRSREDRMIIDETATWKKSWVRQLSCRKELTLKTAAWLDKGGHPQKKKASPHRVSQAEASGKRWSLGFGILHRRQVSYLQIAVLRIHSVLCISTCSTIPRQTTTSTPEVSNQRRIQLLTAACRGLEANSSWGFKPSARNIAQGYPLLELSAQQSLNTADA